MAYAQLDEHFDEHPKYEDLELEHFGLMACALAYCNRLLTDGFVSDRAVRGFGRSGQGPRVAAKLVEKGIWERAENGYRVVGFLDHNPSRAEVLAKREAARARKEAQRAKHARENRANSSDSLSNAQSAEQLARFAPVSGSAFSGGPNSGVAGTDPQSCREDTEHVTRDVTRDGQRDGQRDSRVTSRARAIHSTTLHSTVLCDPPLKPPQGGRTPRTLAAGRRLPEDWKVSEELHEWAKKKGLIRRDVERVAENFRDYWLSSARPNAVKADWDAAFRTWVRNGITRGELTPIAPPKPAPLEPTAEQRELVHSQRRLTEAAVAAMKAHAKELG